jgi:hypothetical protein
VRIVWIMALAIGCQSSSKSSNQSSNEDPSKDPEPTARAPARAAADTGGYHADIAKICDVEKLSGAEADETSARSIVAAEWLGRNLTTDQARDLLARLAQLAPEPKAKALRDEAEKAGLEACPTALAWETLE